MRRLPRTLEHGGIVLGFYQAHADRGPEDAP